MTELRPLLAILGLLVVAGGLFFWIARLRGWRLEWWERFYSPGRARGSRADAGGVAGARSAHRTSGRPDRPRSSAPARTREPEGAGSDRSEPRSGRQTLIDLDFLPLLDPEDAVQAKPLDTSLDREYEVGDLGSVETGGEDAIRPSRTRAVPPGPPPAKPDRGARIETGAGPAGGIEAAASDRRRGSAERVGRSRARAARRGPGAAGRAHDPCPRGTRSRRLGDPGGTCRLRPRSRRPGHVPPLRESPQTLARARIQRGQRARTGRIRRRGDGRARHPRALPLPAPAGAAPGHRRIRSHAGRRRPPVPRARCRALRRPALPAHRAGDPGSARARSPFRAPSRARGPPNAR